MLLQKAERYNTIASYYAAKTSGLDLFLHLKRLPVQDRLALLLALAWQGYPVKRLRFLSLLLG